MTRRGRAAVLPSPGYEPPPRLIVAATSCMVDFYPEAGGSPIRFDFACLPVHRELQIALASALGRITGPSGTRRAEKSARMSYWVLARFARIVAEAPDPPQCAADLTIAHVDRFIVARPGGRGSRAVVSQMRGALLAVEDLPVAVRVHLLQLTLGSEETDRSSGVSSYTRAEERRIVQAARATLHAAAMRIRAGIDCVSRWRAGEICRTEDPKSWECGYLLDYLARTGDIPRQGKSHFQVPAVTRQGGFAGLMGHYS
jgi:hypothetical protein